MNKRHFWIRREYGLYSVYSQQERLASFKSREEATRFLGIITSGIEVTA